MYIFRYCKGTTIISNLRSFFSENAKKRAINLLCVHLPTYSLTHLGHLGF
jgi:hypothetical protein